MNDTTAQVLYGVIAPAAFAIMLFLSARRRASEDGQEACADWRWSVVLGLPPAVAFFALYGWPNEQWQHLAFLPCAGIVLGLVARMRLRSIVAPAILSVVAACGFTLLMWPVLRIETWMLRLVSGAAVLLGLLVLEPLAQRRSSVTFIASLLVACISSTAMIGAGSIKQAAPAAALCTVLLTAIPLAWWKRRLNWSRGPLFVALPFLAFNPFVAWLYLRDAGSATPGYVPFMPIAALALLWIAEVPAVRRRSWLAGLVRLSLVSGVCATALWLSFHADEPSDEDPSADIYRQMLGR